MHYLFVQFSNFGFVVQYDENNIHGYCDSINHFQSFIDQLYDDPIITINNEQSDCYQYIVTLDNMHATIKTIQTKDRLWFGRFFVSISLQ